MFLSATRVFKSPSVLVERYLNQMWLGYTLWSMPLKILTPNVILPVTSKN